MKRVIDGSFGFSRRGQVTLFIILAILVVGGVVAYFVLRNGTGQTIPENFQPVYDYYVSCLKTQARGGISLLGEQGGRINVGKFSPGSAYMPFSSQLDFMGQPVPYWMYVSGNNLLTENVPTKQEMERELGKYISERVGFCDFSKFKKQGFVVFVNNGSVTTTINDLSVDVDVENRVTIFKGNNSVSISSHRFSVTSKLGKFYGLAKQVYDYEKAHMFLEKYALDVMRLYAPVDGVSIGCTPKVFVEKNIAQKIKEGLAANIAEIKLDGSYYDLSSNKSKYFVVNDGVKNDESVSFMYMSDWTTRIKMYGDKVARPVGLQPGMSVLGFCYVPYHFIYDIDFPVMVQFYDDDELFQFPMGVVISKNQPRTALPTQSGRTIESKVCDAKNQNVSVSVEDVNSKPVNAEISFRCLNSICNIGSSKEMGKKSVLMAKFPQCVNGFIIADADGYASAKYKISTNEKHSATIILKKKYNLSLDLGNVKKAVVTFSSDDYSSTVVYPDSKSVELVEGYYNVSVFAYDNSSLKFPATSKNKCVDVPESGLSGMFGATTQKCYNVKMPEMDVSFAVVGGGKTREYITSDELSKTKTLNLNVPMFGLPSNIDGLMANYDRVNDEVVYLRW